MFTQERAPRKTFTYSKSTIETLNSKREICSMLTIKTAGRLSAIFIVNFVHISLFSCVLLLTWGSTLSTYKR